MKQYAPVTILRHARFARVVHVLEDECRWRPLFYVAPGLGGIAIATYGVDPVTEVKVTFEPHDGQGDHALAEEER